MRNLKLTTSNIQPDFGGFVTFAGERYYQICDVDGLPPFFISLAARGDHWLFISSSSGLTAGRSAPEYALFPYVPVDRIHESHQHTGAVTHIKVHSGSLNPNLVSLLSSKALERPFHAQFIQKHPRHQNLL